MVRMRFYDKLCWFDVANNHQFFNHLFSSISLTHIAINWPSLLIKMKTSKNKLKIYCSLRQEERWNQPSIVSMEISSNNIKKKKNKVKSKERISSIKRRSHSFQLSILHLDCNFILISRHPWEEWPILLCMKHLPKSFQENLWLKSHPTRYKRSTTEEGALKDWKMT